MENNSVYREAAKVSVIIFVLGLIEFICFCIGKQCRLDVFLGVLYGCSFTVLKFFYLAFCVKKSLTKGEKEAEKYMSATYSTRMLLTAAMVFFAAKIEIINIWAAIIPLVFQQLAVFILNFIRKKG